MQRLSGETRLERLASLKRASTAWLVERLEEHGNSVAATARAIGCNETTLRLAFDARGVKRRRPDAGKPRIAGFSRAELVRLFELNHRNTRDLARLVGISHENMRRWLGVLGIEKTKGYRLVPWSKEMLEREYAEHGGALGVAERYDVTVGAVYWAMRKFGVPRRVSPVYDNRRIKGPK